MSSHKGGKAPSRDVKESFFKGILARLRKWHIIETLAAFIGGGWLLLEFVHRLLVDHYHFPEKTIDITFVTILGALIYTLIWRWFSGREKPRKLKLELVMIPLVLLITVLLDINLILHLKGPESDRGFINYPFINKYDFFLDNIRGEERFKKLLERVKYEWEHFEE